MSWGGTCRRWRNELFRIREQRLLYLIQDTHHSALIACFLRARVHTTEQYQEREKKDKRKDKGERRQMKRNVPYVIRNEAYSERTSLSSEGNSGDPRHRTIQQDVCVLILLGASILNLAKTLFNYCPMNLFGYLFNNHATRNRSCFLKLDSKVEQYRMARRNILKSILAFICGGWILLSGKWPGP